MPRASAEASAPAPPPCLALDDAKSNVDAGRLRQAAEELEPFTRYCEAEAAKKLRAGVLIDLARYEEARALGVDAPATPATPAQIALSRTRFREALEATSPERAKKLFLEAWELDRPNGLALIHAALRDKASKDSRALFERGVAELERETNRKAHAGRRTAPACTGHFSNYLTVAWLPDSRHALVHCVDGDAIIDAITKERVANADARGIDESRLPRLRFTDAKADLTDRVTACPAEVAQHVLLDEAKGVLTWTSKGARASFELAKVFSATEKQQRVIPVDPRFPSIANWALQCVRDVNPNLVLIHGEWPGSPTPSPLEATGVFDLATGRFTGIAAGSNVHVIDGGRIVVRAADGVTIFDKRGGAPTREMLQGGDVSYDGTKVVFVKQHGGDEMYRPVWPYVRARTKGAESYLGDVGSRSDLEPTPKEWSRVGPLPAVHCASTGTMPSGRSMCHHPGVRFDGVDYDSTSEIGCARSNTDAEDWNDDRSPVMVKCLDPRGPVAVDDPWKDDFVCRVGPHVLPLGACPHLLK